MAIKKINTDLQIEAGLLDGDGNSGVLNQVLVSTGTGVDWVDGSGVIGGPYLPLTAGSSYPLTGELLINSSGVKVQGAATDQYFIQGYRTGNSGNTFSVYDNGSTAYINSYRTMSFRANQHGGSGGYFTFTGGNVGIGTTSPSYRLQIGSDGGLADSIRIGSYLVAKDTRQYIGYTRHDTGLFETASSGNTPSTVLDGVAGIRIVNTTGTLVSGQADNSVQLLTHIYNGGSRIALHANYDGNVGIGTTSPASRLEIGGTTGSYNSGIGFAPAGTGARTYRTFIGTNGSFNFDDATAGSTRINISATGNVGIGTTIPRYQLDLAKPQDSSQVDYIALGVNNGPGDGLGNALGSGLIWKANYTDYTKRSAGIVQIAEGNYFRSGLAFYTNNSSTATGDWDERMRIDMDGNVGIGTTSPASSAKLTIMGNQTFGLPGNGSNASGRFISIEGNADSDGEGSSRIFFTEHNSTTALMDNYGMSIGYRGGGTSITGASGNNWTGLSQIGNGEWGMWGHDNNATGALIMRGDRAATYINFAENNLTGVVNMYVANAIYHTGDTNNYHSFGTDIQNFVTNGSSRLYINASGNVGIGTTSPSDKLQVVGGASIINVKSTTAGSNSNIHFETTARRWGVGANMALGSSDFEIYDYTAGSNRFVLNSNGDVGIGTTAPGQKLSVNGSIESLSDSLGEGGQVILRSAPSGTRRWNIDNYGTSNELRLFTEADSDSSAGAVKVLITETGNVGIGTTSPSQKLDVVGGFIRSISTGANLVQGAFVAQSSTTDSPGYRGQGYFTYNEELDVSWYMGTPYTNGDMFSINRQNTTTSFDTGAANMNGTNVDNFFAIKNNGNVGIGTADPSQKLHVVGDVKFDGTRDIDFNTTDGSIKITPNAGGWATGYYFSGSSGTFRGGFGAYGVTDALGYYWIGDAWNDATMVIKPDAGNVGIGTVGPGAKLHVDNPNTAANQLALRIDQRDPSVAIANFYQAGTETHSFTTTGTNSGVFTMKSGGVNVVSISASGTSYLNGGDVGIGTTSPGAKFHVNGTGLFSDNTSINAIGKYFQTAGSFIWGSSTTLGVRMGTDGVTGLIDFRRWLGSGTLHHVAAVRQVVGGSGRYGLGFLANDISTNSLATTVRMYIDPNSGYIGVGTDSPDYPLHIVRNIANFDVGLFVGNQRAYGLGDVSGGALYLGKEEAGGNQVMGAVIGRPESQDNSTIGTLIFQTRTSGAPTEKMRISSSGNVGIGETSPTSKLHITIPNYTTGLRIDGPTGTTFGYTSFYSGGSYRGAINPLTTGVNYASASDYRLKENIIKLQNSTERIKKLKPSNFNFLEDPSKTVDGFIAHEVQEVVPQAVTGKKDAVLPNGEPDYQGIDQSKLVPLLTAALQEAITKIEQLETRIQTLENKQL